MFSQLISVWENMTPGNGKRAGNLVMEKFGKIGEKKEVKRIDTVISTVNTP